MKTPYLIAWLSLIGLGSTACSEQTDKFIGSHENAVVSILHNAEGFLFEKSYNDAYDFTEISLQKALNTNSSSEELIPLYLLKSKLLQRAGKTDSAYQLILSSETLSSNVKDTLYRALINQYKGEFFHYQSDYDLAEKYLTEAYDYFENSPETAIAGDFFYKLGVVQIEKGELALGQHQLSMASSIFDKTASTKKGLSTKIRLAQVLHEKGSEEEAFEIIKTIPPSLASPDSLVLSDLSAYLPIATILNPSLPEAAIQWLETGMKANLIAGDSLQYSILLYNKQMLEQKLRKTQTPDDFFQNLIQFGQRRHSPYLTGLAYQGSGEHYLQNGQVILARNQFEKALQYFRETANPTLILSALESLKGLELSERNAIGIYELQVSMDSIKKAIRRNNFQESLELIQNASQLENASLRTAILEKELDSKQTLFALRMKIMAVILIVSIIIVIVGKYLNNLYKEQQASTKILLEQYKKQLAQTHNSEKKPDAKNPIITQLVNMFEREKTFLNPTLKVEDIISDLKISYNALNDALKSEFKCNFANFVNQYRIEHAKKLLIDPEFAHLTIEGVAIDCGFGTKQNFYKSFKQITGVTPTQYKEAVTIN